MAGPAGCGASGRPPRGDRRSVPGPRPPLPPSRAPRSRVLLAGLCAASRDRPLPRPLFFVTRSSFYFFIGSAPADLTWDRSDLRAPLGLGSHRLPWFPLSGRQTCWPHLSALPPNDLPFDLDSPDGTASFLRPCCPHAATLSSLLPARRCPRLPHGWSPALRNH